MVMKRLFIFIGIFFTLQCLLAENIEKRTFKGKLSGTTVFQLNLDCDLETNIVYGQTLYTRKNGNVSRIEAYGYISAVAEEKEYSSEMYNVYYLTEFVGNKKCGYFKIRFSQYGEFVDGLWFLDEKEMEITEFSVVDPDEAFKAQTLVTNGDKLAREGRILNLGIMEATRTILNVGLRHHNADVTVEEPILIPTACHDSIMKWICRELSIEYIGQKAADITHEAALKYVLNSESDMRDFADNSGMLYVDIMVDNETAKTITMSQNGSEGETSALHPIGFTIFKTFLKSNGEALTWRDIFINPEDKALEKIIVESMMNENEEIEWFSETPPIPSNDPYIYDDKIGFNYQAYEAAAYAYGRPSCLIPSQKLWQYLTPKAKALFK